MVLMVGYTMVNPWILSQTIVGSPNLSELRAPAGTISLAPFELRERCHELAMRDEIRYDFVSDRPVEFNIHYHDGFTVRHAVKRTARCVRQTPFVAEIARTYCVMWFNKGLAKAFLKYRAVRWK